MYIIWLLFFLLELGFFYAHNDIIILCHANSHEQYVFLVYTYKAIYCWQPNVCFYFLSSPYSFNGCSCCTLDSGLKGVYLNWTS